MNNPLPLRIVMTIVMMIAITAGMLAFAFMKFPGNLIVVAIAAAATIGIVLFVKKQEKDALFDVYVDAVQPVGTSISFNPQEAAFERNGTRFDIEFPRGKYHMFYKINFRLPNLREKFAIQNRNLQTTQFGDCQLIQDSALPPEYHVQSRNREFLLNLLKRGEIRDEILNYPASFWGRILISFDDGDFEMMWTPPISEQIDGFYRVCNSAVVFHDELKKLAGN